MKYLNKKNVILACLFWIFGLFSLAGYAYTAQQAADVNEALILLDFFHEGGSFVITAQNLRLNVLTKPKAQYLIDIRSPEAFAKGHIPGSHHIQFEDVYEHVQQIDAPSYENIVIICFAGQASAYAVSLLRAAGYSNAVSLKWGISSWSTTFAQDSWLRNLSNVRANEFVHTPSPPKNPAGQLPRLNTGKTKPEEILEARIQKLFFDGFQPVMVGECCVFNHWYCDGKFYVINYWPVELYEKIGHIPGAVIYPPAEKPFKSDTHLLTLSTEIPNVLYCYTGQTSAYASGYLRLLGYDARSLLFGTNGMVYDLMLENNVNNTFMPEKEIMDYDYVSGK